MASTGRKWLMGCGIGCAVMVLILGGVGTCGFLAVRDVVDRAEQLEANYAELATSFGEPEDFTPPPDGVLSDAQLGTFLAVRDDLAPARRELEDVLVKLEDDGPGGVIAKITAGVSLVPKIFDYVDDRVAALSAHGMGEGEYFYIYTTAYYAWLGKDPADGPAIDMVDFDSDERGDDNFKWTFGEGDDREDRRRRRDRGIRHMVRDLQVRILANQLVAAETAGADASWLERLRAEADALDASDRRLLWEDGLPDPMALALEPYRDRFDASYSEIMNAVEMGFAEQD